LSGRLSLTLKNQTFIQTQSVQLEKPYTFSPSKVLALRIYPDNRPENMEIAALQKGLILVVNGSELIEEGAGFGVPIVKYFDKTFFSRTATVHVEEKDGNAVLIKKVFLLDSVSKKQVRGASINDGFYTIIHKTFEKSYLHLQNMRSFFDWVMRLRKTMGVETHFAKVPPKGKVTVSYHCLPDQINVSADFSEVDLSGCKQILILNEQGANFFKKLQNGNTVLFDRKIGAWTKVEAEKAEFSAVREGVSFSMENKDGAVLYCGWEQVKDRFAWAGMTYALNPKALTFNYTIRLKEKSVGAT
jgi:hypothetical protein